MLQGIDDLFDLFANGFKDPKLKDTGCLHICNEDATVYEFEPHRHHKFTGTMSVVPTATRNNYDDFIHVDDSDVNENLEVIHAMNDYLDYDSDDEIAMNAVSNL
jgi:hypothetical protein